MAWLQERAHDGHLVINKHVLKVYLMQRYKGGTSSSYLRVGNQIADFVSRYQAKRIEVDDPDELRRKTENVQMPEPLLNKLVKLCTDKVEELSAQQRSELLMQQRSKYFGKCSFFLVALV